MAPSRWHRAFLFFFRTAVLVLAACMPVRRGACFGPRVQVPPNQPAWDGPRTLTNDRSIDGLPLPLLQVWRTLAGRQENVRPLLDFVVARCAAVRPFCKSNKTGSLSVLLLPPLSLVPHTCAPPLLPSSGARDGRGGGSEPTGSGSGGRVALLPLPGRRRCRRRRRSRGRRGSGPHACDCQKDRPVPLSVQGAGGGRRGTGL